MQSDFYKCADLLDELKKIMKKENEERLMQSRLQGDFDGGREEWGSVVGYLFSISLMEGKRSCVVQNILH